MSPITLITYGLITLYAAILIGVTPLAISLITAELADRRERLAAARKLLSSGSVRITK